MRWSLEADPLDIIRASARGGPLLEFVDAGVRGRELPAQLFNIVLHSRELRMNGFCRRSLVVLHGDNDLLDRSALRRRRWRFWTNKVLRPNAGVGHSSFPGHAGQ